MPAFDLAAQTATLSRFDVVGEHSETSSGFVGHVALLNTDRCEVNYLDTVDVVHMKPPLRTGDSVRAHIAGRVPLTNDQIKRVENWIAREAEEFLEAKATRVEQYVIRPPWRDFRDPNTRTRRFRRYSCAGLVLYAYRQVDVELLVIDKDALPEVTREAIKTAYPRAFRHPDLLAKWGLEGDGPWRIVLAGYVLHALDRSSAEIRAEPYVAQVGDEVF